MKKIFLIVLFCGNFLIGFYTCHNYGIAWDEDAQRKIGQVSFDYLFHHDSALNTFLDADHGVAFELPLYAAEKVFRLKALSDVYFMRHLMTHLFFLFAAIVFFLLLLFLFNDFWMATIGYLLLVIHPLIYAHSFFNSKDVPFLSMLIICFYVAAKAFFKQTKNGF